jgi:hypothetical protein
LAPDPPVAAAPPPLPAEPDSEAAAAADEAAALLPGLSLGGDAPAPTLDIDGVSVDPLQLCAVDGGGAPLAVSRMTVRELRAELAARRAPVAGNKKELARRVQKLRQLDGTRSATTGPMLRPRSDKKAGDGGGKVRHAGGGCTAGSCCARLHQAPNPVLVPAQPLR